MSQPFSKCNLFPIYWYTQFWFVLSGSCPNAWAFPHIQRADHLRVCVFLCGDFNLRPVDDTRVIRGHFSKSQMNVYRKCNNFIPRGLSTYVLVRQSGGNSSLGFIFIYLITYPIAAEKCFKPCEIGYLYSHWDFIIFVSASKTMQK